MERCNSSGIVLRQLETPHKVALIDHIAGRIDGILISPVCLGAMLCYRIDKKQGTLHYLQDISVVAVPFAIARSDIMFWHHILELCYFFTPLGSMTNQLFELVKFLYTIDTSMSWCEQSKKIYLFKLIALVGLYSKFPALSAVKLAHLHALPLDMIRNEWVDEQDEKILDEWLYRCMYEHPAIRKFKTVRFLLSG